MTDDTVAAERFEGHELTYSDWREALDDGTLLGQRCDDCDHSTAAPKAACARCGSRALEAVTLPTHGTVYSETSLEVTPVNFENSYQVALVTVDDARIMVHVNGDVDIGDKVSFVGVVRANDYVAPVFEPV